MQSMSSDEETGRKILLVDDDRLILATLASGLQSSGYFVLTAESVDEAEATLAGGVRPDLVVLDINMPRRSGLDLAKRLTQLDHVPYVFLTAYSDDEIVGQAASCGAMGYLVKPVDPRQLIPAVEAAISRFADLKDLRAVRAQLQHALDNERDISVAVGITMMQYHLSRREAFDLLRKNARTQRRKLAELACDLINASEVINLDTAGRKC